MRERKPVEQVHTRIWLEEPEPDNPYAAKAAYCYGYDVYGELVGKLRWGEMLYLLFCGNAPSPSQTNLLEALAIALANAGPRDAAVHAAMSAGVGGSTSAACLIGALAVGAGQIGGGREVFLAMQAWNDCSTDLNAWHRRYAAPTSDVTTIWADTDHPPGFDPHGASRSTSVNQTLERLAAMSPGPLLPWLQANGAAMEQEIGFPLAFPGLAATAFADLGLAPEQGEMLYLLLRLPGAAAHALEQRAYGHKKFPFFALELENDPESGTT